MRKFFFALTGIVFISFMSFTLSHFVQQFIYPAPAVRYRHPPKPLQEVELKLANGNSIVGWHYAPPRSQMRAVLLYFHGNGENLETMRMSGSINSLVRLNRPFFVIDYPGYGRSTGSPTEQLIRETSNQAVRWLNENHPSQPKVVCGWSLGAAVAIQAAAENQHFTDGLIAMSAWSSLRETAVLHYPSWLIALLLRERYDSAYAAKSVRCPSLLIHGDEDSLIPVEQGRKVANNLGSNARFVSVPKAEHNDLLGHEMVWKEIESFLSQIENHH